MVHCCREDSGKKKHRVEGESSKDEEHSVRICWWSEPKMSSLERVLGQRLGLYMAMWGAKGKTHSKADMGWLFI